MLSGRVYRSLQLLDRYAGFRISVSTRGLASDMGERECKFLVVGGGSGGCAVAAKLAKRYEGVAVLEPNDRHYYQPLFTLVGAGIKNFNESWRPMGETLPKKATWYKESAVEFRPEENRVVTSNGSIKYDYMVIATGMKLNFDGIPGLLETIEDENSNVCSIYSPKYVEKTYRVMNRIDSGDAIFTFPKPPVKCPGAPQKIMYLTHDFFKHRLLRHDAQVGIHYYTALPVLFGVKKYADALWNLISKNKINCGIGMELIKIDPLTKVATFHKKILDHEEISEYPYSMLHVCPPMGPIDALKNCKALVDESGFVSVDRSTMQSNKFNNIFGLGDCTNSPNSKTAAAAAAQSVVVVDNLVSVVEGRKMTAKYDGYASCPLVVSYSKCIMAEFDYNLTPLETFPFDQGKPRRTMFWVKKYILPPIYWNMMTKGYWNGPKPFRDLMKIFKPKHHNKNTIP